MASNEQAWVDACKRAARMALNNTSINGALISAAIAAELERHGLAIELVSAPIIRSRPDPFRLSRRIGPTAAREYLRPREVRRVG